MTHAIVLLHGMGKYGSVETGKYVPDTDGWLSQAARCLDSQFDEVVRPVLGYAASATRPYIVVPINYDSTFDRFRDAWASQAERWSELSASIDGIDLVGGSGIPNLVDGLRGLFSGVGDVDNFAWTHLADVALYLAPIVRAQVEADVWVQVGDRLGDAFSRQGVTGWSLLGHSLGTLVTLDLLNKFVSDEFAQRYPNVRPPRTACLLANVAQFLTRGVPNIYSTRIKPGSDRAPRSLLSFSHKFDVLAQLEPFEAPWGRGYVQDNGPADVYLSEVQIGDDDFRSIDWGGALLSIGGLPHEFSHYMKQPPVCAAFWTRILKMESRESRLQAAAAEKYAGELQAEIKHRLEIKARTYLAEWAGSRYFENGLTLKALRRAVTRGLT
ncbi:hypothetical protein H0E84_09015 [Luteimonas sp. SJ-92]|uniref:Uncharacterized protein n=1 Tax=Luteimonas salinisoli TaxID=2752307 RepID=A0A853JCF5_9GAMM|nr:hypothetical protein [Luteimonas salinisoli]NZA26525.1 hypothetical protein [Luteimonas salinisoli]